MNNKLYRFIILLLFLLSATTFGQEYAAALKVSSLGINVEGMRSFGPDLNARLGFAWFNYTHEGGGGDEDYEYTGDLKLFSISMLADYFPFGGNTFRLTGGILINLNKVDAVLTPTQTYTVGGDEYTPDKLGNLNAAVEFNKISPYLGIGIGNPLAGDSGLKFTFDIGTVYQGNPSVDLAASGLLEPSAAPDQEQQIEDNISWFKWYPVIALGLTYKF